MAEEEKLKIITDSFIEHNGHYRKMSEELTKTYGKGFSIGTISNYMNSYYYDIWVPEEKKKEIERIKLANSNNITSDKVDNVYYKLSHIERIKLILELYLSGKTMEEIATELSISKATVSRIITSASKIVSEELQEEISNTKESNKHDNAGVWR